jgi:hypothetical protein
MLQGWLLLQTPDSRVKRTGVHWCSLCYVGKHATSRINERIHRIQEGSAALPTDIERASFYGSMLLCVRFSCLQKSHNGHLPEISSQFCVNVCYLGLYMYGVPTSMHKLSEAQQRTKFPSYALYYGYHTCCSCRRTEIYRRQDSRIASV